MKQRKMSCILMVTFSVILASGSAASAQSSHDEKACSSRTLQGEYGVKIEGTLLGPNFPLRTLALFRFDGRTSISLRSHVVLNGTPPPPDKEWATAIGTYLVNSDCTGSGSIEEAPPIAFHFVVVNRGRQFYLVVDGDAITGEASRLD